jgi:hypothetical protein
VVGQTTSASAAACAGPVSCKRLLDGSGVALSSTALAPELGRHGLPISGPLRRQVRNHLCRAPVGTCSCPVRRQLDSDRCNVLPRSSTEWR